MKAAVLIAVSATLAACLIKVFTRCSKSDRRRCILVTCPAPCCHQQQSQQEQQQHQDQQQFTAHLLSDTEAAQQALLSLSDVHVLGIDCEWQPECGKQHNPVALLQLAAGSEHGCLLLQPLQMQQLPDQLVYILQDPLVIKAS
jgi:hypothetical protein